MPNIGPLEIAIVLVIVLLIFGPKRLPGLGKQLGTGMREFKESITGKDKDDDDDARASRATIAATSRPRSGVPRASRRRSRARPSASAPRASARTRRLSHPMASALRTVAHDDRLSLVEHLTELRVRIVICLRGVRRRDRRLLLAEPDRVLDILNKPLTSTVQKGANDPLEQGSRWDQQRRRVDQGLERAASACRPRPRSTTRSSRPRSTQLAARGDKLAAAVPEVKLAQAGHARRLRAVHADAEGRGLRGPADLAADHPLPDLRVRAAGVLPAREADRVPRHVGDPDPVHLWSRVRLLHGRPARDRVPPELQHRRRSTS